MIQGTSVMSQNQAAYFEIVMDIFCVQYSVFLIINLELEDTTVRQNSTKHPSHFIYILRDTSKYQEQFNHR